MSPETLRAEVYRLLAAIAMSEAHPVQLADGEFGAIIPTQKESILFWLDSQSNTGWYWWLEDKNWRRVPPFDRILAQWMGWDNSPSGFLLVCEAAALARVRRPLEPPPSVSGYRLRSLPKATA